MLQKLGVSISIRDRAVKIKKSEIKIGGNPKGTLQNLGDSKFPELSEDRLAVGRVGKGRKLGKTEGRRIKNRTT